MFNVRFVWRAHTQFFTQASDRSLRNRCGFVVFEKSLFLESFFGRPRILCFNFEFADIHTQANIRKL